MKALKSALGILSLILIAFGVIWFFQGIGVLPGSFMSGQPKWAVIGTITAAVGVVLRFAVRRIR